MDVYRPDVHDSRYQQALTQMAAVKDQYPDDYINAPRLVEDVLRHPGV
jgi:hypothetical protein